MPVLVREAQVADMPGLDRVLAREEQIWPTGRVFTDYQFAVTFTTTAAYQTVTLYMGGCGAGNLMDWGDGQTETFSAGAATGSATVRNHVYEVPGTYQAVYTGTFTNLGSSSATVSLMQYLRSVDHWGALTGTRDASSAMRNLTGAVPVAKPPNTIIDMSFMFIGSRDFNHDISDWDTSNVTNMSYMFQDAYAFDQDLSRWDTSHVTTMATMFYNARAFNGDVSTWDVSAVIHMPYMFSGARAFNQDLSDWNTSKVFDMSSMFSNAVAFNQDLSRWNTSAVTNMSSMFAYATAFNQPIGSWNTSKVKNMGAMFIGANAFNQDLSRWDTHLVTNMQNMFNSALVFNQDLSGWDVAAVTNHSGFNMNAYAPWVANAAWQPQWVS